MICICGVVFLFPLGSLFFLHMSFFPWYWFLAQVVYLLYFLINKMSISYLKKRKKKKKKKRKKRKILYHIQPCDILRGAMMNLQDY